MSGKRLKPLAISLARDPMGLILAGKAWAQRPAGSLYGNVFYPSGPAGPGARDYRSACHDSVVYNRVLPPPRGRIACQW